MTRDSRMNRFFRDYPAIGIAVVGGLVTVLGILLTTMLSVGYEHTMRRFDQIEQAEHLNVKQHQQLNNSISNLEGRVIRVETLIVNGHGKGGS